MATYKDMNAPDNAFSSDFVAAGYIEGNFKLTIGPIRISLSKEEKERTLRTWDQLEAGINPETGKPF